MPQLVRRRVPFSVGRCLSGFLVCLAFLGVTAVRTGTVGGQQPSGLEAAVALQEALETFEKLYIISMLAQNHGHRGRTAAMLGVPRRTLNRKMKKYQIS